MSCKKAHVCETGGTGSVTVKGYCVLETGGELYFWVNYMVKNARATAGHPRSREHMYELWAVV